MFEINEADLPPVPKPGRALLVIDLQQGLADTIGLVPLTHPADLFITVENLVKIFRETRYGKIVWVKTKYEARRPVNLKRTYGAKQQSVPDDCELIITDAEVTAAVKANVGGPGGRPMRQSAQMMRASLARIQAGAKLDENPLGSLETDEIGSLEAGSDSDSDSSTDMVNESFLTVDPGERDFKHKRAFRSQELVYNLEKIARKGEDMFFTKSHYSALNAGGGLLHTLRSHFIQELYICGGPTNTTVYATAMAAAQNGFRITLVEDCLGYRGKERHDQSLKSLDLATGCDIFTSEEIIREMRNREEA